jgi:hypothetical protein
MQKKLDLTQLRDLRNQSKLNQSDFWSRFGVTQSGGSRYEIDRSIPKSLALLIYFWHSGKITDDDLTKAAKAIDWTKRKAFGE